MRKIKMTVKIEVEFEQNPEHYPEGATLEEMLAIDREGIESDPYLMMDDENAVWTITVEPVEAK